MIEALLLGLAAWLAQLMVAARDEPPLLLDNLPALVVFVLILSCCTLSMGVYIALVREGFSSMVLRTLVSFFLLGSASLILVRLIAGSELIDRAVIFWGILLSTLLVILVRWLFMLVVDAKSLRRRVVIYGAGNNAQKLLGDLVPNVEVIGVSVIGCVPSDNEEIAVASDLVIAEPKSWLSFAQAAKVTEIIIAPDERRRDQGSTFPLSQFLDCKLAGVPSSDAESFCERELGKVDISLLQPSWMLFSDGFKYSRRRILAKRIFDLALATVFLLLFWPLMLLTAIAIRLESRGAVIYSQMRVGLNGVPFRIYKFRSMCLDAEKDGAVWAMKNDARVTRVGAFIRNTRLDELPQLYNVLIGQMSFVGPRPERPEFVDSLIQKIPFYDMRHKVKPGLMGWAQLKYPYGASTEDAINKLQYDLYYTKNHSFFMDMLIMIQTVEIILLGKGVR